MDGIHEHLCPSLGKDATLESTLRCQHKLQKQKPQIWAWIPKEISLTGVLEEHGAFPCLLSFKLLTFVNINFDGR